MFENIPAEMRNYNHWVNWLLVERQGLKSTKIPYNSRTGKPADITDPNDWSTFEEAVATAIHYSGIGFAFSKKPRHADPFTGGDLDDTHGDAEAYARQVKIFQAFDSYSELSPSGRGLHIIIKAKLPGSGRRRAGIELYDDGRFFTMTGNVYHNVPIAPREEEARLLWAQLGSDPKTFIYGEDQTEKDTDDKILEVATAAINGEKFTTLFSGDWNNLYPSQSEADFALIDIIAYYTQNRAQISRLFLKSGLGQRQKANRKAYVSYMIEKSFDRQLPPIDIEGLQIKFQNMIDAKKDGATGKPSGKPVAPIGERQGGLQSANTPALERLAQMSNFPPGLLGEVANFIFEASPRPVREIALVGAIGLLAGICGRAYNISGTGLNQYIILIAKTGRGKEAIAEGISKLISTIETSVPAVRDFVGPSEIASPQAILKWLARAPCFYSIVGEFGYKLKEMSDPRANPAASGFKRVLLDLYNKSGKGKVLGAMAYSKREDNTAVVHSPAFTLIGESTPLKFYEQVSEDVIRDGLVPRFMLIDYEGPRVEGNETAKLAMPTFALVEKLAALTAHCLSLGSTQKVCEIPISENGKRLLKSFDGFCDSEINIDAAEGVSEELWNRAHLKALKLAGLYAVSENYIHPEVSEANAAMAIDEIYQQTFKLKSRFDNGEIGGGSVNAPANEEKQLAYMVRVIAEWACNPWKHYAAKYKITEPLYEAKVFPYNSLHMRLIGQNIFKNDRRGASQAILKTYQLLLDADDLREMSKTQMLEKFGKKCRAFCIANAERFIAAN